MLSQSIVEIASSLEAEFASGVALTDTMQIRLVNIMKEWAALAEELEGTRQNTPTTNTGFSPKIVAGTDKDQSNGN